MAGLSDIVDVQIQIQDTSVARPNFGTGLIVGSSDRLTAKIEVFDSIEAVEDVFEAGDPELKMAQQYFGQDAKPEKVYIAQRDADVTQATKVIITALQNATLYRVVLNATNYDYTSDGTATREEIVDGLIAAIGDSEPVTFIDNGDDFTITAAVAGDPFTISTSVNMTTQVVTANVNIQTELALIEEQNDEWYVLMSASHVDKDVKRCAEFIQSRRKLYSYSTQNTDVISPERHVFLIDFDADFVASNTINLTIQGVPVTATPFDTDQTTTINDLADNIEAHPLVLTATVTGARQITVTADPFDVLLVVTALAVTGGASQAVGTVTTTIDPTTDLGAELKALSYDRTYGLFHTLANTEYPEAAWSGGRLPFNPGSQTWAFKTLRGVTVDNLTAAQKTKARGNNVNTYTSVGGVFITQDGKTASGRFIDIRRGTDWLTATIEAEVYSRKVNSLKIPFTNAGITKLEDGVRAAIAQGQRPERNFIALDPEPVVTSPKASEVSSLDRIDRILNQITFTVQAAGAIHKTIIRGTLTI